MSHAPSFLTAMAQAISTMNLYKEGHPARERAVDKAYGTLVELQAESGPRRFSFLGDEVILDNRPLRELKHWDWAPRFSAAGIQRLEFIGPVTRDDFDAFLEEALIRVTGTPQSTAEIRQGRPSNIRYGEVGIQGEEGASGTGVEKLTTATLDYSLKEEIDALGWLQDELKSGRQLQMLEAQGIVRSLSVAMHGDQAFFMPLLRLKEFDQYTVTHTLNVAVLTMSLAEFLGLGPREVRAFGISGLLHDMGKVKVPEEILNKPGKLTAEERAVINSHTTEGARLILEAEEHLDLAAVVAYEHHIRIDGGGYPALKFKRACHHASDLVHVCDVFDALRTDRPYRKAWPTERALGIIKEGAGPEFDKDIADAFVKMMGRWEGRIREVSTDHPEIAMGRDAETAWAPGGSTAPTAPAAERAAPKKPDPSAGEGHEPPSGVA